jgi:hypothetical protein
MKRSIVSFGCSFVRGSHDVENPRRANKGDTPTFPKIQKHETTTGNYRKGETCFTSELGEIEGVHTMNYGIGGTGVRSAIFKALDYIENNSRAFHSNVIIGISELSRFDFVTPTVHHKWPKLPEEEYAKYFNIEDVVLEIKMLLKLTYCYFKEKNIPVLFINTMNCDLSTRNIVPTFIFPNGMEHWRDYITSYDSTYRYEHPNIADHKHLAKLLVNKFDF